MDFDKEIITHICGFSSVKVNILDCDSRGTSSILVFTPTSVTGSGDVKIHFPPWACSRTAYANG